MANPIYNLPEQEKKIMNFSTQEINESVKLGDRVQHILDHMVPAILDMQIEAGTPVNAVASAATLNISGVVIDGETVSIGEDVYEFCADAAQSVTDPANFVVDIKADTTASSIVLTMDTQPTPGDTVTLGGKEYTWVPIGTATADGEIDIGADIDKAQANFVAAVNGDGLFNEPHPLVSAADFDAATDTCVITALVGGVAGDLIDSTSDFDALSNAFAAAKLAGGADCSAADAVTALVGAINASDTQGVAAADGAGNTVVLTADVAGEAGDAIEVAEDMANGAFVGDAVSLEDGVDATVTAGPKLMVDDTWLYVCFAENTVADANWRRITLGNVF